MEMNWMTIVGYILAFLTPTVIFGGFIILLYGLHRIYSK